MEQVSLKTHYSVYELADLCLFNLPKAPKNISIQAKRENWQSRKRTGRGGGLEYALSSLPQAIQQEIYDRFTANAVKVQPQLPAVKEIDLANITTKQRQIADARMALVAYIAQLEQVQSRDSAIKFICNAAQNGQLPTEIMQLINTANSKKRRQTHNRP